MVVILDWLGRLGARSAGDEEGWRARVGAGCRNVGGAALGGLKFGEDPEQAFNPISLRISIFEGVIFQGALHQESRENKQPGSHEEP